MAFFLGLTQYEPLTKYNIYHCVKQRAFEAEVSTMSVVENCCHLLMLTVRKELQI